MTAPRPYDRIRGSASSRGYDRDWRKLRAVVLAEEPLCRFCLAHGMLTPATEVDHIETVEARPDLRLVRSNLRSLCKPHHSSRTASGNQDRGCDLGGRPLDQGHPWNRR
ncbi:HNH endonuclease signature motif containing protein [Roseomonas chloroacetimidivorans]|uniref:HNH endonuclease signature motif containing protein n=1 Tax=Roseomonas chloroacetimidivorans TaxID=1766656 RepID=UPI003C76A501